MQFFFLAQKSMIVSPVYSDLQNISIKSTHELSIRRKENEDWNSPLGVASAFCRVPGCNDLP
jgi:hypothetical protein